MRKGTNFRPGVKGDEGDRASGPFRPCVTEAVLSPKLVWNAWGECLVV